MCEASSFGIVWPFKRKLCEYNMLGWRIIADFYILCMQMLPFFIIIWRHKWYDDNVWIFSLFFFFWGALYWFFIRISAFLICMYIWDIFHQRWQVRWDIRITYKIYQCNGCLFLSHHLDSIKISFQLVVLFTNHFVAENLLPFKLLENVTSVSNVC